MTPSDLTLQFLEDITNGFSEERKLGSGGYGEVYKGVDRNGREIAVKKLYFQQQERDDEQFKNEFNNLMKVQHQNIVRLVGYCYEIRHKLVEHNGGFTFARVVDRVLCFEYMQGGSLDKFLSEESSGHDWPTHYKIIKGVCEGLYYLHGKLKESIFHLDLKPANILLDQNMVPKIADFGLSRLFGGTQTHTTKHCVGTQLYMPPEYMAKGKISDKYDVFSLGVIIKQIMTGRDGYSKDDEDDEISPQQFIELVHKNWRKRIEATSNYAEEDCQQVKRCIEIALNCVEADRHKRPTIRKIIHQLKQTETNGAASSWDQAKLAKIGQWGGTGGNCFDIAVAPHRLKSLVIGSDEVIYSLEFSYYDNKEQRHIGGPWGGLMSNTAKNAGYDTIELGLSEYLIEVSGTIGPFTHAPAGCITSLTLVTNTRSYGPFGGGGGTPFQVPMRSNCSIVGFFGRGDWYLDALGVYVNPKQEAMKEEKKEAGISKIGQWGGTGGTCFDINVAPDRLESVTICSAAVVDSLAFSYRDKDGQEHTPGPWGGPGGSAHKIQLGPSEFLMGVSGTTGPFTHTPADVVTSVTLVTNARSYGPFGEGGGTPFQVPMRSNGSIVGFFGRADLYVDAIGFYLNPKPIKEQEAGLTKIGPWGGNGGNAQDINVNVAPRRLQSITIRSAAVVDSLAFSYRDQNGQEHTAGPWGGPSGSIHQFELGPSEFVTEVFGTVGPFNGLPSIITSLKFVTNADCYGPFGEGGGTPFQVPMRDNGSIVGFFGRAESYVDAIGFYLNPEQVGLTKIGPWGGNGGNAQDININVAPRRLRSITIRSATVINSLAFSYKDQSGHEHTAGPWGGPSGSIHKLELGPSEFVTEVFGTIGPFNGLPSVITSLKFVTNADCYGPFGQGGGIRFHAPMHSDDIIVGFFGRTSSYVDAIGFYVVSV